ncbi:hypothetical protein GW17_00025757 [Ensete ventricosum]|nr:hypothetical protein GW17_00025757 [Ensete ventricosum]RZS20516.1 hypothetical protein BHM03_00053039 [Ensete ventricosum]
MRKPRASLASKKRKALAAAGREEEGSSSGGSKSPEELQKESNKGAARGKRVKAAKPKPETEYLPEKRNMEDLWQAAFPVGTEVFLGCICLCQWDNMDKIREINWDFSNLEVSQMLAVNGEEKVVLIPIVVARLGLGEHLGGVSLKRVAWSSYKALEPCLASPRLARAPRSALRHLKVERVKQYDYCLPCKCICGMDSN